ncbi:MAG: YeeE/YedE family protein [Betaproteobacteria bacterium]|nr:YeeE/YedE family protein [Betaproteobacteria bacterium]
MSTLTHAPLGSTAEPATATAQPFMNPYLAGFMLGLVLLATYVVMGRGLGATAGFAGLATWLASFGGLEHLQASGVHMKYWNDGAPLLNWTLFLLIGAVAGAALSGWQAHRFSFTVERGPRITDGQRLVLAFVGGFIAACGAKLAKGCTSGQALTGASALNVSGLVFLGAVFVSAFIVAQLARKEWL